MHWISGVDDTVINMAHVARVVESVVRRGEHARHRYALYGADGEMLGVVERSAPIDWLTAFGEVLPAAPGTMAYKVLIDTDGYPTLQDVYCEQATVIGWRVSWDMDPQPILVEEPANNETVVLCEPAGRVMLQYSFTCDTLFEMKQHLLHMAQSSYRAEHPEEAHPDKDPANP